MKFEHILQIYWTKGFFFGGSLFYVGNSFNGIFDNTPGLSLKIKKLFILRFELTHTRRYFKKLGIIDLNFSDILLKKTIIQNPINIIYSQVNSVNNTIFDLKRLNILRKYLIKSYIGRCHALGKPVRGQRTWSNSWNSFKLNTYVRNFVSEINTILSKYKVDEKINYKMVKKKLKTKKKSNYKLKIINKKNKNTIWY